MPLVSVVMSSYNHGRFISQAIESVLNQSFKDFELIIVDDASKDSSKDTIKFYQGKDVRIRTIFHGDNKGISKTINDGLEEAKGKFVAFIASDDIWVTDKLQKQLEILGKDDNLVVWSDGLVIDAEGSPTGKLLSQMSRSRRKKKRNGDILSSLLLGNYIWITSIIFKKVGIGNITFDENLRYLNDHKFVVDLAKHREYYFIPEQLIKYRIHGENSILKDKTGWGKDLVLIRKYFLEEYKDKLPRKTKCKYLFHVGYNQCLDGDLRIGKKNILNAITVYPFRIRYLRFLFSIISVQLPKSVRQNEQEK